MRSYKPKTYINKNNKIGNYIKFTKKDKVLGDFIDYFAFYGKRDRKYIISLLSSDNAPSLYVGKIAVDREEGSQSFKAYGSYSYMGIAVRLFRIWEIQIGGQLVLKVDLYGKGLKVIRDDNLRHNLETFFTQYLSLNEIKITRIDYTVDCAKYRFNKKNSLKTKIKGKIEKENNIEYLVFGRKGASSRFIRYYDKKKEIIDRGTTWLYPEYYGLSEVMRYELQVNSDGLDSVERYMQIKDIQKFINFGFVISDNTTTHKKIQNRDESLYARIKYGIIKLQREKDHDTLKKIKMLLFSPKELCSIDYLAGCEILEVERPFELS